MKVSREQQEPTIKSSDREGEKVYSHPAYGQIVGHRVSGRQVLYGSDFQHNGYITITIRRSDMHRNLSTDWHYGRDELIEVMLSEAQWATFVSSLNMGMGVPCTINRLRSDVDGGLKRVPELPEPKDTAGQFKAEADEKLQVAIRELELLMKVLSGDDVVMSNKSRSTVKSHVTRAITSLRLNLPFVADQFGRHMEKRFERAKIEVMAWMQNVVARAGITALGAREQPIELVEYRQATDRPSD